MSRGRWAVATAVSVSAVALVAAWQPWLAVALVLVFLAALLLPRRHRASPEDVSAPAGVAVGALLAIAIPVAFCLTTPDPVWSGWVGPLLIAIAAGVRLAVLIGAGQQRLVESMFWLFCYVFLGLAPLVQLRAGDDPGTTPDVGHQYDATVTMIVAAGTLAFAAGSFLARDAAALGTAGTARVISQRRIALLIGAALVMNAYYLSQVGIGALFENRTELSQSVSGAFESTTGALVRAFGTLPLLVAFVAWRRSREAPTDGRRLKWLPLVALVVLLVSVNPISSARYSYGTVLLSLLAAAGLFASRHRFRLVFTGAIAGLLVLFPLADAFRRTSTADLGYRGPVFELTGGDFDAWAQINNTVAYVAVNGFEMGRQLLGPLLFWVPRGVWPGKPIDTGTLLAEFQGYRFTNLSAPLWGELFINGGWLLLVVGMFLFGRFARRWDTRIVANLKTSAVPGVLAAILPFYLLLLLRGSLLQAMATLATILLSA